MSALAKYLLKFGKKVGGSDAVSSEFTDELIEKGVKIDFGDENNIDDYEAVIYTDAVSESDIHMIRAKELNKTVISRGQFLYEISRCFKKVIAVSGCHGKTTCSAMLSHIFAAADKKFACHIGGKDLRFSNFYFCGNDFFITEACEYKKNFLRLKPNAAVILNSDPDHLECYGSEDELKKAYVSFADSADADFSLYKDIPDLKGINFGFDKSADYYAENIRITDGKCRFTAYEQRVKLGNVSLDVYGRHNVLNALAAMAVARFFYIPFEKIAEGLSDFKGVERRFEKLSELGGVKYYADYAHHPNELRASLKTARRITRGKLYVVFQPHTYSRTKLLMNEFVKVLNPVVKLLVYKTFAAREYYDDSGSALTLSQKLKKCRYGDCPDDISDFMSEAEEGDTVIFLGAVDIYYIAKQVLNKNGN